MRVKIEQPIAVPLKAVICGWSICLIDAASLSYAVEVLDNSGRLSASDLLLCIVVMMFDGFGVRSEDLEMMAMFQLKIFHVRPSHSVR